MFTKIIYSENRDVSCLYEIYTIGGIGARGYKTFFMLNSTEHETFHANKSQITNNAKFFLAKHS